MNSRPVLGSLFRILFLLPVFGMVALVFSASAAMAASPLFTIEDVQVDVTAENAAQAREQAFAQAQVQAFEKLAARMVAEEQAQYMTTPDPVTIATMIQDFEVTDEKLSDVRYIGTYTFRFRDKAVRQYFSARGVEYTDVSSKPVLVLPFFQQGGEALLWSPYNSWIRAWNMADNLQGLVPLVVPIGDLEDVQDIGDNEAMSYSDSKLAGMLQRYGAGEAVLLIAIPDDKLAAVRGESDPAIGMLTVQIYRTDRRGPEHVQNMALEARAGETKMELLQRAVAEVRKILQRNWKQQTVASAVQTGTLQARVKFSGLEEWVRMQKLLSRVYGVEEVALKSLTPAEAYVELRFQGDERRLRLALEQADMVLDAPQVTYGDNYHPGAPVVYDLYRKRSGGSAPQTPDFGPTTSDAYKQTF